MEETARDDGKDGYGCQQVSPARWKESSSVGPPSIIPRPFGQWSGAAPKTAGKRTM